MNVANKTLSICIPTFNRASYLRECLESILTSASKYLDHIEIVISDNASTDNTKHVVQGFQDRYSYIRYNRNEENVFDENFFTAASLAKGDYIWIFADDDKMEKGAINEVLSAIDKGHNLIICNYSIWNKDLTKKIKEARYGFKLDMNFHDSNKLLRTFGIGLQFVSSIIIKKDIFLKLPESEYTPFHEYGCSFLLSVYSGIRTYLDAIFISRPLVRYRGFNSNLSEMDKWYKYFATGSTLLLDQLQRKGYSSRAIYAAKHKVLKEYIMHDISFRKRNGESVKSVFGLLLNYYKRHWFFWLICVPLLYMHQSLVLIGNKSVTKFRIITGIIQGQKIKRIINNPERIVAWVSFFINRLRLSQVERDGKIFYRYKGDLYPEYLNKGNAISFIMEKAKKYCRGRGIDVGADIWPFPDAIPIRNEKYQNAYELDQFDDGSLDYVISSHCLEHLDRWQDALKLWIKKLKNDGIIFLYLPHKSNKLWHPGGAWGGPGHKWAPSYEVLTKFLSDEGIEIIEYNHGRDEYWSFHVIGKKAHF